MLLLYFKEQEKEYVVVGMVRYCTIPTIGRKECECVGQGGWGGVRVRGRPGCTWPVQSQSDL